MNWIRRTFEISHTAHKVIRPMEGIRGFAVFLVFLVHYMTLIQPWLLENSMTFQVVLYTHSIGNIGVDLFFVLSGYLIYGMLIQKHRPFKNYLLRRVQRIYPTFTVVFVIYLVLSFFFVSESKIPSGWDRGLIFVLQNYLLMPGLFDVNAIITVAWSLSYEFFYYLLMPVLITVLSMRSWEAKYRIVFFLCASLFFFTYFSLYGGPIRLLMFVSGILLYETIENKFIQGMPPLGLPALLIAILSVVLLKTFDSNGWWGYVLLYMLFYVFCLECFLSSGFTSRLFSVSPLRWLGNMSYSYYLLHGLVLKFIFMVLGYLYPAQQSETMMLWILLPPIFFLTLIPSSILFIYIEKPYSLVRK
ncbi:Exopolysaccharide production protein ExoZ [methanotrophic endosymbiont of Bathymodiolus puteoserpentis (Logatchev)]|nr:Exopolysaccharide production protein ExoZ [methanotrophic endosymbiont of Bathymodiolus puteoserpentis (Logatchev)]